MKSSERLLPETNGERELTQIHDDHRSHRDRTSGTPVAVYVQSRSTGRLGQRAREAVTW